MAPPNPPGNTVPWNDNMAQSLMQLMQTINGVEGQGENPGLLTSFNRLEKGFEELRINRERERARASFKLPAPDKYDRTRGTIQGYLT